MSAIGSLFELQRFLARENYEREFTIKIGRKAWDSLLLEASRVPPGGWLAVYQVEVMGTSGALRIVGPHGWIHVERGE